MLKVKKATYVGGYKLKVLFSNRKTKMVDFEEWIFEEDSFYLKPLRDVEFFKKFKLDQYTIVWPNGADFSPDMLYAAGREVRPLKVRKKRSASPKQRSLKTRRAVKTL